MDIQYLGKAQPHCNKGKSINHNYIVQVVAQRKKKIPVLFPKQDMVSFTFLAVKNAGSSKCDIIGLKFSDHLPGSKQQLHWEFHVFSQQEYTGEWTNAMYS